MHKKNYSPEEKLKLVNMVLKEHHSLKSVSLSYGVGISTLHGWIRNYETMGAGVLFKREWIKRSIEEKEAAVKDYLRGEGSLGYICKKYKITDTKTLRQWIMKYNSHEEIKASGTGGNRIMTKGRTTTFDERVELVQYCIAHNNNYCETAEKYKVSYQQARNYTHKYESGGIDALKDNRGKSKPEEQMTELERLRAENRMLRAEKERAEMEVSFLKKLEEIERRRG